MAQDNQDTETSEEPAFDWSTAEVKDATLTVTLTSEPSDPWKGVFERTVKLLGGGDWESVELESEKVKVTGVHEGAEGSLRHFLEGAVQEANSALRRDEEDDEPEDDETSHDERDEGDSRMTERFRDPDA